MIAVGRISGMISISLFVCAAFAVGTDKIILLVNAILTGVYGVLTLVVGE